MTTEPSDVNRLFPVNSVLACCIAKAFAFALTAENHPMGPVTKFELLGLTRKRLSASEDKKAVVVD